jgi:hypothetical protein
LRSVFTAAIFLTVIPSEVEGPLTLPFSLTLAKIRGSSTPLRSAQNDKMEFARREFDLTTLPRQRK